MKRWLMTRSEYFRDDLIRAAKNAAYKEGWLEGEQELLALAHLDWSQAEPILQAHAAGDEPRCAAEVRSILFEHAIKNKDADKATLLQKQLQAAVADKRALPEVRDIACRALDERRLAWPRQVVSLVVFGRNLAGTSQWHCHHDAFVRAGESRSGQMDTPCHEVSGRQEPSGAL